MSHVTCISLFNQTGEANPWRVNYQQGLPRLFLTHYHRSGSGNFCGLEVWKPPSPAQSLRKQIEVVRTPIILFVGSLNVKFV